MDEQLAAAQALRYADELKQLYAQEREQRQLAEEAASQLASSYAATVRSLAAALELRGNTYRGHAERVTTLALGLAERVAPDLASEPQLEYGFLLHDIGQIALPDAILCKPGALDAVELEELREHPRLGERIVAQVPHLRGVARDVVAAHHERWDGTGYPRRLVGPRIPLAARIFSVADAFDAMTTDRPYRDALPAEIALTEIAQQAGRQFDPGIARAFVETYASRATAVA